MKNINQNPFSQFRTEQMDGQTSLWQLFVEPSVDYIGQKPLIFEGSRGTGKTMFFMCNSWSEKYKSYCAKDKSLDQLIAIEKHIGFYYKVDGRYTKSLSGKNVDDHKWLGIFNAYFNLVLLVEILDFIEECSVKFIIDKEEMNSIIKIINDVS